MNKTRVHVKLDLSNAESIHAQGTMVDVIEPNENETVPLSVKRLSLAHLCKNYSDGVNVDSAVVISWPLIRVRRTRQLSAEDVPIQINTEKKTVLSEYDSDMELREQNYDADKDDDSGKESSDGEHDVVITMSRNRRLRLLKYQQERVKNDIAHIFFRFQRVLSVEHGAYHDFMTDLRDAFFVVNQNDLDECIKVLRGKYKLTDEQITNKILHEFDWFLRRVRRVVPEPPELEKRYMAVYSKYHDIECAKSGRALFSKKDAKKFTSLH